jgi:hypothetical protein
MEISKNNISCLAKEQLVKLVEIWNSNRGDGLVGMPLLIDLRVVVLFPSKLV